MGAFFRLMASTLRAVQRLFDRNQARSAARLMAGKWVIITTVQGHTHEGRFCAARYGVVLSPYLASFVRPGESVTRVVESPESVFIPLQHVANVRSVPYALAAGWLQWHAEHPQHSQEAGANRPGHYA